MESAAKKSRLDDDFRTTNCENSLNTICDWTVPNNVAIEHHESTRIIEIKYSEVDDARIKVENVLKRVEECEFIGINFDVQEYCIPALMLGINSCGRGFINLPVSSIGRSEVCASLQVKYLFSQSLIPETEVIHQFDIHDRRIKLIKWRNIVIDENKARRNHYAYAITTSGTTGVPKVVKVPHSSIVPNVLDLRNIFNASKSDKIARLTTLTFDPSIVEIFLSLSCGGTLFTVSEELKNDANELLNSMFESKVTILQNTPSLLLCKWSNERLRETILSESSELRILLLGGEPFPKLTVLSRIKHRENKCRIFNIYGITEVSCWASINEIDLTKLDDLSSNETYLGKPLSQTVFEVRTENNDVVNEGEGILYIGSSSRICLIDDEEIEHLEKIVFRKSGDTVMINDQGNIFYKGRCDSVVKKFGNRLDLKKLERTVLELNFVKNCLATWDEINQKLYLCFTTINSNQEVEEVSTFKNDVKLYLQKLPSFYRPDRIYLMDHFNLTANGKICTTTLIKTCILRHAKEEEKMLAAQSIETIFRDIWKDHFRITSGGFLRLGGNSVIALQIIGTLTEMLKVEFPELIGMLLRDEEFEKCLEYVLNRARDVPTTDRTIGCNVPDDFRSVTNEKLECNLLDQSRNVYQNSSRQWQKCRGRVNGCVPKVKKLMRKASLRLEIQSVFDLRKCVDASPTIFQTASGKIFATVGSHSGIIRTVELTDSNPIDYTIELPSRIEASVLILDNFKGVVGCYDGFVYCLDLQTGEIYWKLKTNETIKCTAIVCKNKDYIYVGSYDHYLYCLSAKDGAAVWRTKAGNGSISATPCIHSASNLMFFGTLDGTCAALKQTCGAIVWQQKLKDPIFSAPAVSKNECVLFCNVSGELNCFDIESGEKMWMYSVDDNVFSHLIIQDDPVTGIENIILTSRNKNLHCLELPSRATGPTLKYNVRLDLSIFATPYCDGDLTIVAGIDGSLCILEFTSGELLTSFKLNNDVFSSPVMHDDRIVVGCRDNNLYVLKFVSPS